MQLSFTEENYLKSIYSIQDGNGIGAVSVNEIAERMQTRPATVTDMIRRLSEKELIHYEKYKKVELTDSGLSIALQIVRKHRLWETFLYRKLHFSWDEVHEVAEQLEHIRSQKLIDKLDQLLEYPDYDPHGDPIPNAKGELPAASTLLLSQVETGQSCVIAAVKDTSPVFLQQLEKMRLEMGTLITVLERMPYDNSLQVLLNNNDPLM
ncbi:MAG: metal-dependent transcriptional regulator, partial [Sphingobacteriales bacterium]